MIPYYLKFFSEFDSMDGDQGGGGSGNEGNLEGSGDPGSPPPITVDEWRKALSDDLQKEPSLVDIKTVGDLAKSYVHAQRLVGSDKIQKPKEDWTDEQWTTYFDLIGRPESHDGYDIAYPEGAPEGYKPNEKMESLFKQAAHKNGLTQKQAAGLWSEMQTGAYESFKDFNDKASMRLLGEVDALKKEWGADYNNRMTVANQAALAIENGGGLKGLNDFLRNSGAGQEPMIQKLLFLVGSNMTEAQIGTGKPSFGLSPNEAEAKARKIMQDDYPDGPYHNKRHPGHKDRVAEVAKLFAMSVPESEE